MAVKYISGLEVEKHLNKGIQIVNVFGTWCGPCKMLAPILEEISKETETFKIDIDENPEYAAKMQIKAVPTTLVYNNGTLKEKIMGFVPKNVIESKIEEAK
ncbi:MAG: thioredoxin family protein [Mycoplasmatales bacterium]|nr:thioredoxin family protein [Mycoplasmatales bacterium]